MPQALLGLVVGERGSVIANEPKIRIFVGFQPRLEAGQSATRESLLLLYRLGLGAIRVPGHAYTGIRAWLHIGRPEYIQLESDLVYFK